MGVSVAVSKLMGAIPPAAKLLRKSITMSPAMLMMMMEKSESMSPLPIIQGAANSALGKSVSVSPVMMTAVPSGGEISMVQLH